MKKYFVIALSIFMVISFAACSSGENVYSEEEYNRLKSERDELREELDALKNSSEAASKDSAPTPPPTPTPSPAEPVVVEPVSEDGADDNAPPESAAGSANTRETELANFEYKEDASGAGMMITKFVGDETRITIPAIIREKPVTAIGESAFSGAKITLVRIPDSVTAIGKSAFKNCRSLKSVVFGANLKEIGESAFQDCDGLISIVFPASLKEIGQSAFASCDGLKSIVLPEDLKEIGQTAFSNCNELISVKIPETVTSLGGGAFKECKGLKTAEIPNALYNTSIFANSGENLKITRIGLLTDYSMTKVGDTLEFGGMAFKVLEVQGDKALIITENIIETRAYHGTREDITWAECDLRQYLNYPFFDSKFTAQEQKMIADTAVVNSDNPERKTPGGADTTDKIFLLSIDEANRYFPDDASRIAFNLRGEANGWWLRSPGHDRDHAASVDFKGYVIIGGYWNGLVSQDRGVRPALWLNLQP